jgi:hypothetical protein
MTTTILTGLPRSGTTLLCAMLNEQPNTVALVEPMRFSEGGRAESVRLILSFAEHARREALAGGSVKTMLIGDRVSDNLAGGPEGQKGLRRGIARAGELKIDKPLTPDFRLYIKHPAPFTALTEELSAALPFFALIRHPLAVVASWRSVAFPVNQGRVPAAERIDPALAAKLDRIRDAHDRQVELVAWFLSKYARLPAASIIRYEDLVADPRGTLSRLQPDPIAGAPPKSHRLADRYPEVDFVDLARRLKRIADRIRPFYPDIDQDLDRTASGDMPF